MKYSLHFLTIFVIGVLLGLPGILSGPVFGHDILSHLLMSSRFSDQFWSGDIYPRWLWKLNADFGSPVFHYYGPIPFYFVALLNPLLGNEPEGWRQLEFVASFGLILSGFTAYAWLKRISGERGALVGAILYMAAPYHLSIDFYQRFAFGELWGFVWMPLVLLFVHSIVSERSRMAIPGLAISYALLIATHLPTTLLFSPIPLAYALWATDRVQKYRSLLNVCAGMILGIGLSAVFLFPALNHQGYARFDIMNSGHFVFQNSFLMFQANLFDGSKSFTSAMTRNILLAFIVMLTAWLLSRKTIAGNQLKEQQFWVVIAVLSFLMMLSPSKPAWQIFPMLEKIQFAWRLGILMTLASTAVISLWVCTVPSFRFSRNPASALILIIIFILQAIPSFENDWVVRYIRYEPSFAFFKDYFRDKNATIEAQLNAAEFGRYGFFLPKWVDMKLFLDNPESVQSMANWASDRPIAQVRKGEGSIVSSTLQSSIIEFQVHSKTEVQVAVHQFYYPGWIAFMDGSDTQIATLPTEPDGLVAVSVPPGTHFVRIERRPLAMEVLGKRISLLSFFLLVAAMFRAQWPRQTGVKPNQQPPDQSTADAFATSWNHLPAGSVYTQEQFEDWLLPVTKKEVHAKEILELGCGNGSLMVHMSNWTPKLLEGVDLGDSVTSAQKNMANQPFKNWCVHRADMIEYKRDQPYDLVYSIGVLHHLKRPKDGLDAVISNTKSGGRFHCWVYAREGNALVMAIVEPIRRVTSRCPWWFTKYCVATPLVAPYFVYAKSVSILRRFSFVKFFPLFEYSTWIGRREFSFFRHVAFDQLVTPQTTYISESTIWNWLSSYDNLDKSSLYVLMRNGNSWKFGGVIK